MKPRKQKTQKDILFILISSFIMVVLWIGFNIYHIWITSTISQDIQLQLTPIAPNFDPATIQQLKTRENINPSFERAQQASQSSSTPKPSAALVSEPTPSASLTPSGTPPVSQVPSQASTAPYSSGTTQLSPSAGPIFRQGQ